MFKYMFLFLFLTVSSLDSCDCLTFHNLIKDQFLLKLYTKEAEFYFKTVEAAFESYNCIHCLVDKSVTASAIIKFLNKRGLPTIIGYKTVVKEWTCNGFIVIASHVDATKAKLSSLPLYSHHRIVCIIYSQSYEVIKSFCQDVDFFKDADVVILNRNRRNLMLHKNFTSQHFIVKRTLGANWYNFYEKMKFPGKKIVVTTFDLPVFSHLGPLNESGVPAWVGGIEMTILKEICKRMQVDWVFMLPKDNQFWGFLKPDGKWTGGIFEIVSEGLADVGAGSVWITNDRFINMKMSVPIGEIRMQYLVRRPKLIKNSWYILLKPFQESVWVFVILTFLWVASILWLYCGSRFIKKTSYEAKFRNISYLLLYIFAIQMATSSINLRIKNVFLRYILNIWTVYCYLLSIAFCCGFVPHLTTPEYSTRIDSVKGLVETNHFWGVEFPLDLNLSLNLEDPWELQWSKRFILFNNCKDINEYIRKDNFAVWGKRLRAGFILNYNCFTDDEFINYEVTSFSTARLHFAYLYKNGSPYMHAIDVYLCRLVDAGIVDKIIKDSIFEHSLKHPYTRETLVLTKRSYKSQKRLTVLNLRGVFSGLILGWILSFVVIICELRVNRAYGNTTGRSIRVFIN